MEIIFTKNTKLPVRFPAPLANLIVEFHCIVPLYESER